MRFSNFWDVMQHWLVFVVSLFLHCQTTVGKPLEEQNPQIHSLLTIITCVSFLPKCIYKGRKSKEKDTLK
jgi:hypothetical protein